MSRHAQSALRLFQSAFKIITICIIVVIIIIDFYLTLVKICINDKTNKKSQG